MTNRCEDCGCDLTDEPESYGDGVVRLSSLCVRCDAADRDNFAWLTGTGRFAQ